MMRHKLMVYGTNVKNEKVKKLYLRPDDPWKAEGKQTVWKAAAVEKLGAKTAHRRLDI
jgi:hypothetical protein